MTPRLELNYWSIYQLEYIVKLLKIPLITIKLNEISALVVSRVANFAVDLPDANILVQLTDWLLSESEKLNYKIEVLEKKPKN